MSEKFREKIEQALRVLIEEDPEGSNYICANWLIITEWADYDGTRYLHTEVSEAMTPWNAYGMMRMAKEYNKDSFGTPPADEEDELMEDEGDE
jgi:hypothetical protein